jgi:enolase-phosphatase E1
LTTSDQPSTAVRALLLDIEGTTTPVEFVSRVLFPYAREHIKEFLELQEENESVLAGVEKLRELHATHTRQNLSPPSWADEPGRISVESAVAYVHWLMDRDDKSTALKSLQGKVWESGYRSGKLLSQVYADVPPAFARWRKQHKDICIYSSGSVLAQKLLFANTNHGDLTRFICEYFDTTVGPKKEPESYRRITVAKALAATDILFVSDIAAELDAAQLAGMQRALCVRPELPQPASSAHRVIYSFDEIFP